MCWSNYMAIPIILKKPLRVYKVGTTIFDNFISLFQGCVYPRLKVMPTVAIKSEFTRRDIIRIFGTSWMCDTIYINEGYHSYLTKEIAKLRSKEYNNIGIFEIPDGATIYVNYRSGEVVSTDIKYLEILK